MIDLHLHLDGSLTVDTIIELSKITGVKLPTYDKQELIKYISVDIDCKDLNEYLKCFELPLSVLQTEKALEFAAYSLCSELKKRRMIYAEIRFAPQLHIQNGLTQEEAANAVVCGVKNSGFFANVILCCMRGDNNHAENMETVKVAKNLFDKGVVALDLAGAEGLFKTENFKELFILAKELEVPFTIHAGEADGADSVRCAAELGAKRIGHGIRAVEDVGVIELLKEKDICLELCPTSNIQTKAVRNIKEYPLMHFVEMGIKVTINTDNMTVSNTDIQNEFKLLEKEFNIDRKVERSLIENSINAAFINDDEKSGLLSKVKSLEKSTSF